VPKTHPAARTEGSSRRGEAEAAAVTGDDVAKRRKKRSRNAEGWLGLVDSSSKKADGL
jgi:hypothetical protein